MDSQFEETTPYYSRWSQDGAEYIQSNAEWCARCAKSLIALRPMLCFEEAFELAQEWSLDDNMRCCAPEALAADMHEDAVTLEA